MENTDTEQVKRSKDAIRRLDEDDILRLQRRKFLIPTASDLEKANDIRWSGDRLDCKENSVVEVIVAAWIYDFPVPPEIFAGLELSYNKHVLKS